MSLTASARSVPGTLRQELLVAGRYSLTTDQPPAAGGEGLGPSPHELLPAGLAACIAWALVQYGRNKDWDLGEVQVDVELDHHVTPRLVHVRVRLTGDLNDDQLARLERVAAACPLRRTLESGFEFVETVERETVPLIQPKEVR